VLSDRVIDGPTLTGRAFVDIPFKAAIRTLARLEDLNIIRRYQELVHVILWGLMLLVEICLLHLN
jgi:hypothetical protein